MAQYETGLQYLAPILLDYKVNDKVASRDGNRDPYMVPHGAFPCKGEDCWCVISVSTDEEWKSLCKVMGNPAWSKDKSLRSREGRKAKEDQLELKIGEWTKKSSPQEIVEQLQSAGIRAGIVNTMKDIYTDPQLTHRGQWVPLEHKEIGTMQYQRPPFILSKSPAGPEKCDPLLGEHNEYFFKELLGLSTKEYTELVEKDVID